MKLNPEFLLQPMPGETVMVPVGKAADRFRGVVRLNKTAAFLVEKLKQDTTSALLCRALDEEYDGTTEEHARAVETTLNALREVGALIE